MHDVYINPIKNRLHITLGDGDYADVRAYVQKIESACKVLTPGFTCLTVLNRKGLVRQSDMDLLFNTADLVYAYGANKMVHVRKNHVKNSFSLRSRLGFQTDFPVEIAKNIQEAEEILDGKRLGDPATVLDY